MSDDFHGYMCPNCVTPWKCNGPHIPEPEEAMSADRFEEWWDAPKEPLPYGAGKARYRECWLASRKAALEEAAKVCMSVDNYANPMTARDCADAILALKEKE